MNAKLARKRSKAATSMSDPTLDLPPTPVVTDQPIISTPAPAPPQAPPASAFAKVASEILTPDMSDVDKLQKLKEYILADQHPYFTSAPKVAHLLSLRDPSYGFNASVPTGDYDRATTSYQPSTSIPLAERLSSPGTRTNGNSQEYHPPIESNAVSTVNHRPGSDSQDRSGNMNIDYPRGDQDVEMSDSRRFEPSGPTLNLSLSQGQQRMGHPDQEYQQQPNMLGRNERPGYDDGGRRSPRGDSRGWNKWDDGRGSHNDPSRPPVEANGRYGEVGGRYGSGSYRGGYGNQGNRRHSLNDRPNVDQRYNDNRNFEKRTDYGYDHPDQRRVGDRAPAGGNRGPNFYNARGSYDRRIEEPSQPKSPQATAQTLQVEPIEEVKIEETHFPVKEVAQNVEASTLEVSLAADPKEEPGTGTDSPLSLDPGLPPSTTDSTIPLIPSPDRTEAAMDSQSVKGQEEKYIPNRSPPSNDGRDGKPHVPNNRNVRPYVPRDYNRFQQDNPPSASAYQKPLGGNRPYGRPRDDVRDERPYAPRGAPPSRGYHRAPLPANAPAPVDDHRFIPRDTGYADEPGYTRRDYRPGDWEAKRDDRPPLDRSYDRDRDRDYRAPVPLSPRGAPKLPLHAAPHQRYPPERVPSRPVGNERPLHDPYPLAPLNEHRGYGRDSYGEPLPPASSAYREPPPRVRPRSMSPPRRDYRQDDRPPAKRMRGPEPAYPPSANGGQYASSNYGPPGGRPYDYPAADRRPPPQGPLQGAYYRLDDRGPLRY